MNKGKELTFTIPQKRPFNNVYQFKITLLDTHPPVWRRIQVPESYTFYDLHVAIQNAMGWLDCHLHCFEKRDTKTKHWGEYLVRIDCPFAVEEFAEEENTLYTTETPITQFFKKPNDKIYYTYDFGDNWEHQIVLEKILPKRSVKYPLCLEGKLACPPEDCGSIPGYYDCIEVFKNKNDKELLEWMGDWDPNSFDPKEVVFEDPKKRFEESWEG
ncbi:hypothetical protein COT03_00365 [Candidatus Shapirobacteria bacterium CG07_land_8_20_14_0_80_39_18]|uniref:Plasmid pRiA4b Orf3-like domain-containing protein n=1 Tax=Candidatus Shapirobacteria bacterium CG07_land_8_20_14_0_80_39_18 TaxID=1974882 RepID=A0A2M6YS19_9BACT|nr:MAG: hypothetical protein COT03_00365 [Candidatus Shapirobacteria bacterium CG07_land_8_20_14_0_80_39_18]